MMMNLQKFQVKGWWKLKGHILTTYLCVFLGPDISVNEEIDDQGPVDFVAHGHCHRITNGNRHGGKFYKEALI